MREWGEVVRLLAYLVALGYCLRIRADHPAAGRMRRAWEWMGVSAGLSILRHAYELTGLLRGWELGVMSWRQILIVLSLLSLTVGLVELWRAFQRVGLGLRWRGIDWVWLGLIVVLAVPAMLNWERMGDARSPVAAMRYLQFLSAILLAVPAMLSLGLHRISEEMTGGKWAVALRWMVGFLLLRLVNLCVVTAWPEWADSIVLSSWAAPWLFAMAAAERWSVTRAAERMRQQIFVGANKAG